MNNLNIIGAEVYAVISKVSVERQNKIPVNVLKTFKQYENNSYEITIEPNIEFEQQNISKQAKDIIFAIAFNYWLTPEEKQSVTEKLRKNELERIERFDPENLFKKHSKSKEISNKKLESNNDTNSSMIEVNKKEKWYTRIFKKIISIFTK